MLRMLELSRKPRNHLALAQASKRIDSFWFHACWKESVSFQIIVYCCKRMANSSLLSYHDCWQRRSQCTLLLRSQCVRGFSSNGSRWPLQQAVYRKSPILGRGFLHTAYMYARRSGFGILHVSMLWRFASLTPCDRLRLGWSYALASECCTTLGVS